MICCSDEARRVRIRCSKVSHLLQEAELFCFKYLGKENNTEGTQYVLFSSSKSILTLPLRNQLEIQNESGEISG
jgi:hypothetical protein